MKNYKSLLLLLILCLFIPVTKVFAVTASIISEGGAVGGNPVFIVVPKGSFPYGTCKNGKACTYNGMDYIHMQAQAYKASLTTAAGTKTVPAICMDPLYKAYQGPAIQCTPVNTTTETGAAIKYLMANYGDKTGTALIAPLLAIRNLAYSAGVTSSTNTAAAAIGSWSISEGTGFDGNPSMAQAAANYAASGPNGSYLATAQALVTTAKAAPRDASVASDAGEYVFTFTLKNSDASGNIEYIVSSNYNVAGNVTFTCSGGCSVTGQTWATNSKKGTLKIHVPCSGEDVVEYTITYNYMPDAEHQNNTSSAKGAVYSCRPAGDKVQGFLVYDGDNATGGGPGMQTGTYNGQYTCTLCDAHGSLVKDVKMCCDSGQDSTVREPQIKQLFCNTTKSDVRVIGNVPGNQALTDYYDKRVNTYCKTYCTERVYVTTPPAISGRNGKYFKLTGTGHGGTGPFFEGYKTCRLVTDYKKWQNNYVKATEDANAAYNSYQQNKALYDSYQKALETINSHGDHDYSSSVTGSVTYTGTCSSTHCSSLSCSDTISVTCDFWYKYNVTASTYPTYTYTKSRIQWNTSKNIQDYSGLKVLTNGNGSERGSVTGYYKTEWKNDYCGAAATKSLSTTCNYSYTCRCEVTCPAGTKEEDKPCYSDNCTCYDSENATGTGYRGRPSRDVTDIQGEFSSSMGTASSAASTASSNYSTATGKLQELEELLGECNNYYTEGDGHGSENYGFNPTVNFIYYQVYVNSSSKVDLLANYVPFDVTCNPQPAVVASGDISDSHGNSLGVNAEQYNTAGSAAHLAQVHNFKGSVHCNNNSPYCGATLETDLSDRQYYQKYVTDAYYYDSCTSTDESETNYTIYPYGSVQSYSSMSDIYTTGHPGYHYVEFSTFRGEYLTLWMLSGLGTPAKKGYGARFDDYFKEGTTCSGASISAELGSGVAGLSCKLGVRSSLTLIKGCMDGVKSKTNYIEKCCPSGNCNYRGEDELAFSFKIVDSEKLFPDDGHSPEGDYAANWYTYDPRHYLNEIEDNGRNGQTFAESRKTYEFILTTSDLEAIKEYNNYQFDHDNGYADFKLTCKCMSGGSGHNCNPGKIYGCESTFITKFYQGKVGSNTLTTSLGNAKLIQARSKIHYIPKP